MKKIFDVLLKALVWSGAIITFLLMALVTCHMIKQSYPAFAKIGVGLFAFNGEWHPLNATPSYSIMTAIGGTIYVSLLAVIFSMILGVGCAFFLEFYMPRKIVVIALSFIDVVAGVPSVIFGFIGLTVLVPWFEKQMDMSTGECVLAAGILLAVMLLPFVISTCSESIEHARKKYEPTALALGLSKEMLLIKIIFPAIKTALIAATMMAFGRGLGETMAVMMVIGNSTLYPKLLGRSQTIPALTALEMGSVGYGSLHLSALYAANVILLGLLLTVLGIGYLCKRRASTHE